MKRNYICGCLLLVTLSVFGWGQKGHDTVAIIAENHLTPRTKEALDSLLGGYSIVYWANWLDNASHTPEFAYTKTWHYKNIDEGDTFENAPNIPEGNIIDAIYEQVACLKSVDASNDEKSLATKMIVHFLGDIHQPMHMGRSTDRGGNSHNVSFFKENTNLHSVWDTDILEAAHAWSHSEWQREIDRLNPEETFMIISDGSPEKWGNETYNICKEIYENTPTGTNIEYDYIARWTPMIEIQLVKGGLRLADVLNSVFDPEYVPLNSFVKSE